MPYSTKIFMLDIKKKLIEGRWFVISQHLICLKFVSKLQPLFESGELYNPNIFSLS
ncbi:unnamed protein product [Arabidopsis halleri]